MPLSNIKITASRIGDALIIGLLFLAIFQLPVIVTSNGHDAGSQAAYEYWTLHGFVYGKDIIQNVGPLGFLSYPGIYTGFLDDLKLWINMFLTGSFVFLLWSCSKMLPVIIRITFLILAGFFVINDVMFYLLLLLVSHQLMFATRLWIVLLATLLLALLALAKGTCFFIALFIVMASIVGCIFSRRFIFAGTTAVGFVIFLLTIWVIAGQSPANFPAFAYAMVSFSSGYNEAMTIFESGGVKAAGFIALLSSAVLIFWRVLNSIRKIRLDAPQVNQQLLLSVVEFFILFVVWKHGFVRADGHVAIFFWYVLVSHVWILFRREPFSNGADGSTFNMPLMLSTPLAGVIIIISLVGINAVYPISPIAMFWSKYYKIEGNLLGIVNIPELFGRLDPDLKKNIAIMQLPKTRALAGMQLIGYFGMFPAAMLYNELNYITSPSTISFASWNDRIMKADAMFFRDDSRAPAYLLFDLKTIDSRLVAQDDALAQLEILHRYEVVGLEAGNIILHRILGKELISRSAISEHSYRVGDWVDVPQNLLDPVWVKVRVKENFLAHVVAFAYKPSQYSIEVLLKNGTTKTYKFIPQMAATGFLINPFIVDNRDALSVRFQHINDPNSTLSKVVRFRVACDKQVALCGQRATVTFEDIHGFAMGNDVDLGMFYRLNAQMYDFDAELTDVMVANPVESRAAFGEMYYQFHAPSRITLHKPGGIQKLTAFYGMHPTSYEQGGATDGVELAVRFVTTMGKDMLIFRRDLNPIETPRDRGEQSLDVNLPSDEGTLFIEVNPKQSAEYDQFLIRKLIMQKPSN
ncbi:MAG: hypothetical protein Q7S51_03735 [Gallionellaceae bacterium]|nr:hypothetical protein [Gallionellaceae bacterium]